MEETLTGARVDAEEVLRVAAGDAERKPGLGFRGVGVLRLYLNDGLVLRGVFRYGGVIHWFGCEGGVIINIFNLFKHTHMQTL